MAVSKLNGWAGMRFRTMSGDLEQLCTGQFEKDDRGFFNISAGDRGGKEMNERTEALSAEEGQMKKLSGWNTAVTNSVIWVADLVMLFTSAWLFQRGIVEFEGVVIPTVTLMSSFLDLWWLWQLLEVLCKIPLQQETECWIFWKKPL